MDFHYYLVNSLLQSDEDRENKLSQEVLKKYKFQLLDLTTDSLPNYPCIIFAHTTYLESSQVTQTMLQRFKKKINDEFAILVLISGSSNPLNDIKQQAKNLKIDLNERVTIIERSVTQHDPLKTSDIEKILSSIEEIE